MALKRWLPTALAVLLLAGLIPAPVFAWEYDLKGEYEFRFRYVGRTGEKDLFGQASLQDVGFTQSVGFPLPPITSVLIPVSGNVGFAGPNIYNRGPIVGTAVPLPAPGLPFTQLPSPTNAFSSDSSNPGISGVSPVRGPSPVFGTTFTPQMRIVRGGFSRWGSDAEYNDSRLTVNPTVRVNQALRVSAVLTMGGLRHKYFQNSSSNVMDTAGNITTIPWGGAGTPPFSRYYMSQESMNAYDTASLISVEQFRLTAQLPIGILSLGVKDFPFGTGATFGNNTRNETFLTVVPYGPFRFLHGIWLARNRFLESWGTTPDKDQKNSFFQGLFFTYETANLSIGGGSIWRKYHANNGIISEPGTPGFGTGAKGMDESTWVNLAYFKYFNGRFFANAEYASANADTYFIGLPQQNVEAYHFFSELGTVSGPAKLSLVYALASGRVLNNHNPTKVYLPFAVNYQAMEPYQFLMFDTYAGGINGGWNPADVTFVADEHGMMTDAFAFAGRLDYAVASNLNVWASYIWAHRLERAGFPFGGFTSVGSDTTFADQTFFALNAGRGFVGDIVVDGRILRHGWVSNGYIGWEANAGVDWKLLEGLTAHFRYSYWKPGDWFTEAYQAVAVKANGTITPNGVLKSRDALNAFTASLLVAF